jgi:hypothetical protein
MKRPKSVRGIGRFWDAPDGTIASVKWRRNPNAGPGRRPDGHADRVTKGNAGGFMLQ